MSEWVEELAADLSKLTRSEPLGNVIRVASAVPLADMLSLVRALESLIKRRGEEEAQAAARAAIDTAVDAYEAEKVQR